MLSKHLYAHDNDNKGLLHLQTRIVLGPTYMWLNCFLNKQVRWHSLKAYAHVPNHLYKEFICFQIHEMLQHCLSFDLLDWSFLLFIPLLHFHCHCSTYIEVCYSTSWCGLWYKANPIGKVPQSSSFANSWMSTSIG